MIEELLRTILQTKCAVIGGGAAGITASLELADAGIPVDLFCKTSLGESNSWLAAGGIATVQYQNGEPVRDDSYEKHIADTLGAGKGLNDAGIVKFYIEHFYPDVIQWLQKKGVQFNPELHSEGGHSGKRVWNVGDATGAAIMEVLTNTVRSHPNITVHEHHAVIDLITKNKRSGVNRDKDECQGFYAYDINNKTVRTVAAKGTIIATGGLGKVFSYTSNSDIATGDGFAICYRAGLPLANMEFVQFHPTVFYDPGAVNEFGRRFLFTEALRGAGAFLKLQPDDKEDFISALNHDKRGSKATRDVVSRAMDVEMRMNNLDHVWLDCSKVDREVLEHQFNNAYEFCKSKGLELASDPIPVVYAVHYSNGGVVVGPNCETALKGCYVIGETSYSGLDGATRLASNSFPYCIASAVQAARHFIQNREDNGFKELELWDPKEATQAKDPATVSYYWNAIRTTMTRLCGIARHEQRLNAGLEALSGFTNGIHEYYWAYHVTKDFLEVRNIAEVALIIMQSAALRRESRACHFREDFPQTDDANYLGLTMVRKGEAPYIKSL